MVDPRVQARCKRCRQNNLSILKISRKYYELSKRTLRCNGVIFHNHPYFQTKQFQRCNKSLSRQKFYGYDPKRIQIININLFE